MRALTASIVLLALALPLLAGCDFDQTDDVREEALDVLERRREIWANEGPEDYALQYTRGVDGGTELKSLVVYVTDGTLDSSKVVDTTVEDGPPASDPFVLTIEGTFDEVERAIRDANTFGAAYNSELGYPVSLQARYGTGLEFFEACNLFTDITAVDTDEELLELSTC